MFNVIQVGHGPRHVTVHEERHEHRAPTDESVRLLSEMEQKMQDKVISVNRLKNNLVEAHWTISEDFRNGFDIKAHARIMINGREIKFTVPIERGLGTHETARKMAQEFANRIAENIFIEMVRTTPQFEQLLLRR